MVKNLLKSLGFAFMMVLFPVVASIIIQVNKITNDTVGYGIQAIFFGLASIIGFIIYKKNKNVSYSISNKKEVLWFLPIVFIELIVFMSGVNLSKELLYYVVLLVFTIFVGISEELFFRGIILDILKTKNLRYAIVTSSILFSLLHLTNIAGGVSIEYVILQVIFAFLFGVVAAQLTFITKSIISAIIWHFTHDFVAFITGNELNSTTTMILIVQCLVLIGYAIYLDRKLKILK